MYPNVLFSNAAHCLPAPASYEYHNRVINCISGDDNTRPLILERPAHFAEVQESVYQKSNDDKSMNNTSTLVQHISTQPILTPTHAPISTTIVREIPTLPIMPIYSDTNAPLFSELFHLQNSKLPLRTLDTQPFIQQQIMTPTQTIYDNKQTIHVKELPSNIQSRNEHIGYISNRYGNDFTNSHLISSSNILGNGLNHNKYLDSILSSGNYVPVMTQPHKISVDIPLTKLADDSQQLQTNKSVQNFASSQPYSSIGYANQPMRPPQQEQQKQYHYHQQQQQQQQQYQQHMQYSSPKNQFSFIEESTSQKTVEPISNFTNLTSHQVKEALPTFTSYHNEQLRNKTVEPSIYDIRNIRTDEIKPSESISIEKNYERSSITDTNNTSWKNDMANDVYSYEKELEDYNNILPRVDSADSRKSVRTPSLTDVDDLSSLARSHSRSPPKNMNNFSFDDDGTQHITQSVKTSISNDEIPKKEDGYQYKGISDSKFYHEIPTTSTSTNLAAGTSENQNHKSSDGQEKLTRFGDKRRSSIDSGSLVKSTKDDSELRKKSIAPNLRRRYSVAANLLDLQKNVTNIEPFYLQSSPAIKYREDENTFDIRQNSSDNKPFNTTFNGDGQKDKRNSMDAGAAAIKIEDIVESVKVVGYNDQQISSAASVTISQQPVEIMHGNEYGEHDENQIDISSYYANENNAPYSTYETNDQAYVETAMENLHLDNVIEQQEQLTNEMQLKQFDDEADKIRVSTAHRYFLL